MEYQIDMLNFIYTTYSTIYVDTDNPRKEIVMITTGNYVSPTYYFEAVMFSDASDFQVKAQLYDITAGAAVAGSEITTTSTLPVRVRSGGIVLVNGHEYKIQLRSTNPGVGCYVSIARIVVVDGITAGWTAAEEQVEIGNAPESTTSTSPVQLAYMPIFLWEQGKRNGVIHVYFEATFYSNYSIVEARLYDLTTNTLISTLLTANTSPTRLRSIDITVTNNHEYGVYIRCWFSMDTCHLTGAKIIITQAAPITETQVFKKTGASSVFGDLYSQSFKDSYLDKSNLPSTQAYFYEATLKATAGFTAYSDLWNDTDNVTIAGSERSTVNVAWTRLRSGSLTMTDLKDYDTRVKSSDPAQMAYASNGWIIMELSTVAPPPAANVGLHPSHFVTVMSD